ncbi:MAG TPA: chemotaxis protein CheX [Calditrichia bacterium]|nr:chemotaxis protein CheX [Calditrichota bacterium]HQU72342.1 chemotaxis protein CheX [Calditrichia bacterium]HQV31883.1 chemotaxis protein CheX [Calditrichia bacterium]
MKTPDLINVDDLFEKALSESLEGLAFIELESHQKRQSLPGLREDDWVTRISIDAPFQAFVTLIFDDTFANDLVENVTMEMEKITETMIRDALAEVANTVVGRLAYSLLDGESDFSIGLPSCERGSHPGGVLSVSRKPTILEFLMVEGRVLGIFETPDDANVKVA